MLPESAGGALMFRREQFEAVNGYAVSYWGWGLEVHYHCPLLPTQISPVHCHCYLLPARMSSKSDTCRMMTSTTAWSACSAPSSASMRPPADIGQSGARQFPPNREHKGVTDSLLSPSVDVSGSALLSSPWRCATLPEPPPTNCWQVAAPRPGDGSGRVAHAHGRDVSHGAIRY